MQPSDPRHRIDVANIRIKADIAIGSSDVPSRYESARRSGADGLKGLRTPADLSRGAAKIRRRPALEGNSRQNEGRVRSATAQYQTTMPNSELPWKTPLRRTKLRMQSLGAPLARCSGLGLERARVGALPWNRRPIVGRSRELSHENEEARRGWAGRAECDGFAPAMRRREARPERSARLLTIRRCHSASGQRFSKLPRSSPVSSAIRMSALLGRNPGTARAPSRGRDVDGEYNPRQGAPDGQSWTTAIFSCATCATPSLKVEFLPRLSGRAV